MGIGSPGITAATSSTPSGFFEELTEQRVLHRIGQTLPLDVTVAFHIQGAGGGEWQVSRGVGGPRVSQLEHGPKDCTVRCSAPVFMDIVRGRLDARDAFLDGRLRLSGDIGLALRLQGIISEGA